MRRAIQRGWRRRGWLNRLLYPLSLGYAGAVWMRRHAYRIGILRRHKLPVPLIVVGNLSVGGTGKTPLVMELVERLKSRGMTPGVISRGYGGRARESVEVCDNAAQVGDEPLLIARRCHVPVAVGRCRVASARLLIRRHRCDIIVSDDGFQHLALRRDLDIVLIDGERRFGNGWCLPAGPLRELPEALRRADIVVVNGAGAGEGAPGEFGIKTHIDQAVCLGDGRTRDLGEFPGETVHAIAGIGNPERFFRQLEDYDIEVVAHAFPDHHPFTRAEMEAVLAAAADEAAVLMTEKDAVKCEALLTEQQARRCWAVPLRVALHPQLMKAVLARIDADPGTDAN